MKIISPFKDYYDHQVSVFGIDPIITYERIQSIGGIEIIYTGNYNSRHRRVNVLDHWTKAFFKMSFIGTKEDYWCGVLHVCNIQYVVHYLDGQIYYGNPYITENQYKTVPNPELPEAIMRNFNTRYGRRSDAALYTHDTPTDLNVITQCPILLHDVWTDSYIKNIKLSDYNFGKMVSADKLWMDITNFFLSMKDKDNSAPADDKTKIVSHGFDIKTSFRKM